MLTLPALTVELLSIFWWLCASIIIILLLKYMNEWIDFVDCIDYL